MNGWWLSIVYKFWNDSLLRREIDLHLLRQSSGRHWSYPGPHWMLLATFWQLPILFGLQFLSTRGAGEAEELSIYVIKAALVWQTWLLCLRAVISCSVSVAEEVEKKTLVVLHTTPLGLGRLLATKLGVCLWPLLVEVYFIGVFAQVLNWAHPWTSWQNLLQTQLFQLSATLLYGSMGLWLGGVIGHSEKAASSARATAVVTTIGCLLVEKNMAWPVLVVGGIIWFCLMLQPSHSQQQTKPYQGLVMLSVMLLLVPSCWGLTSYLPNFEISQFSPLVATYHSPCLACNSALFLGLSLAFSYLGYRQVFKAV